MGFAALAVLLAYVLGRRDLLFVAIFCTALPLLAGAGLYGFKSGFSVKRHVAPRLARVGQAVTVVLEVRGHSPAGTRTQLSEELPPSFHEAPRFSHPHPVVPRGLLSRYEYRMVPGQRGVFTVGPLRGMFSDPFYVAYLQRALDDGDELTVAPAAVDLVPISLSDGRGQDGSRSTKTLAHASHDDAMTREYRPGDPLRRVHWPVTARQGKLMVRAEESVTAPEAAIVLDRRHVAFGEASRFGFHTSAPNRHSGGDAGAPAHHMRTTAAFEKAVVAAMSVATHLLERGYTVRVLDHGGRPGFASSPSALSPAVTDFSGASGVFEIATALAALELAEATAGTSGAGAGNGAGAVHGENIAAGTAGSRAAPAPSGPAEVAFGDGLAAKLHQGRRRGPLVAIVGSLSEDEARLLATVADSTQSAYAIVICYDEAESAESIGRLRRAGWRAAALTPRSSLAQVWTDLDSTAHQGVPA